ncbi:MAG: UDP-N-acetylmuramate--L-alanine ligase [Coxiellaceae bacterium]|nr:UDP-N-acetylmuramate--L-alanine ligase [Coxiellaceae bacterium]|tara:strand:- start:1873 stop:3264 length:1392 start_codon:yes stop_codon:yes gene_type:complete
MYQQIEVPQHVYCLGIGGIGVGALAEYLHHQGWQVSGSDTQPSAMTMRLQDLGVSIFNEHQVDHLENVDKVVYSSAIPSNHPVLKMALQRKIPVMQRGKLLADILSSYYSIVVAGTHGKTTTVSLMAYLLKAQGLNLNHFIGGSLNDGSGPVALADSQYMLAEADESDGSFLFMKPKIAVVTNIDPDHLATYQGDFSILKRSFLQFMSQVDENGLVVLCIDHPVVRELLPSIDRRVVTYGFSEDADFRASHYSQQELNSCFRLKTPTQFHEIEFNLPGQHNVLNLLACTAVAEHMNVLDEKGLSLLKDFPGVGRRLQLHLSKKFDDGYVHVFEDYGHHPCELEVTIKTLRQAWPDRRLVMIFQPHRYSRTHELFDEFVDVLGKVDLLLLMDVFSAGESTISEATSEALARGLCERSSLDPILVCGGDSVQSSLGAELKPGDIILFQGAGSIGRMAKDFSNYFS